MEVFGGLEWVHQLEISTCLLSSSVFESTLFTCLVPTGRQPGAHHCGRCFLMPYWAVYL